MYEEPDEGNPGDSERPRDPAERAREKSEEFRMHAELAAVFEGCRKFDAQLLPSLSSDVARDVQRRVARLEKAKTPDSPILPPASAPDAAALLGFAQANGLSDNDYHVHRRPGEVMILRWLRGPQVQTFYERMQAHYDAAMGGEREDERQANEWKQDPQAIAYLAALEKADVRMADRYLRDLIRTQNLFVLSTVTADEMDVLHLCDYLMGVTAEDLVGNASAPPREPTERDRAWFFKLFSLRGMDDGVERMHFFTFMQKSEDTFDL